MIKIGKPRKHFRGLTCEETQRLINLIIENTRLYDQIKKEYHNSVPVNSLYTQIVTKTNIEGYIGK